MLFPKETDINEAQLTRLINLYKNAAQEIAKELTGATDFGIRNRKAILRQIDTILTDYGVDVSSVIDKEIRRQYQIGATDAVKQLDKTAPDIPIATGFNNIHQDAISALIDDTSRSFADSIQGVRRSTQKILSQAAKQAITERMAVGKVGGQALRTIRNSVAGAIENEGFSSLIDKGGHAWSLDRYAEMLIRTKSVEARNTGLVNRMVENDFDLVQVSAHGGCDLCAPWEGAILSISGDTPGYPTVDEAEASGLFHPNCKHAINTLIPDLAAATDAYNPNIDTLTGNDFVDQVDEELKGYYKPPEQKIGPKIKSYTESLIASGWSSNALKAEFDGALLHNDAATVKRLLPKVPDSYKNTFAGTIKDVLKK